MYPLLGFMVTAGKEELALGVLVGRTLHSNAREGREAYGLLVQRTEHEVRALLRSLCKNHSQADDLAQDAYLSGWQNLRGLKDPDKFLPWIKRLSYRLFLHAERRRKVESRYLAGIEQELQRENQSMSEPATAELDQLLSSCRPLEAELMVLVYAFGFTIEEIAQDRNQPVGTLKSQLARAKQRIRTKVEADQGAGPVQELACTEKQSEITDARC